jgi:hypothetical protein
MMFCFFASFINFFDENAKLIPSIVGTIGMFAFLCFWLWMIVRNYLQVFVLKKEGIYTHKGFRKYIHFNYENIKKVKVVTFDCPPKFEKGAQIRGIDSILSAPKIAPKKWIVITDGREDDNLRNYNSYLVPIRNHMVIKFEHTEKREKMLAEYVNFNIEYQTISFEEMNKYTPKIKTL